MTLSVNLYTMLSAAQAEPKRCAPRPEAEPQGATADLGIGREASESHFQLSRTRVEDEFSLAQLETVVGTIAGAPQTAVYSDKSLTRRDLWNRHPELKALYQFDEAAHKTGCQHYHLYYYMNNPEYWNNAILLLSVLAQKNIELDSKEGIQKAIGYCRQYRARIEAQGYAGKKFSPVEYYQAILDLTEAELKAQVKRQPLKYYTDAQAMAQHSLTVLSELKNKYFWPSEPDYFTISKGLLVLGDLNVKIKEVHRREIAGLRQAVKNGKKDRNAAAAEIGRLEQENDRLISDAHLAYGALASVKSGFSLKLSNIQFNFSRQNVETALKSNVIKGYIDPQEAAEAYKGIFRYLQAVAALKKNSLLPQLRRPVREDELIGALKETDAALGELRSLLAELKAETRIEKNAARKTVLQRRADKMQAGFYLHFGGLVRADLSLGLLDRMNFAVIKRERPEWKTFLKTIRTARPLLADSQKIGQEIDQLAGGIAAALSATDLPAERLEKLRNGFTELVTKQVARGRYERIRQALLASPGGSFRLKYLYGWDSVKLIELAVRAAEYVKYSGSRKDIGQANRYIQECEQLKVRWIAEPAGGYTVLKNGSANPRWAEAESYFDDEEYLGIELNYLESIFYAYRYDQKIGGTGNSPAMIDSLSDRVKANANYLPEEQLSYFSLYSGLKNGIAQIQRQKFEAAAGILERIKAQVEGNGHASSIAGYLEPLAWDEHTLKAELYHQLAVAYSWIEKDKPPSDKNLTGIYAIRAYKECNLSTSIYDKILRPKALASDLKLGPDGRKIKSGAGAGPDEEIEVIR